VCVCICVSVCCHLGAAPHFYYNTHTHTDTHTHLLGCLSLNRWSGTEGVHRLVAHTHTHTHTPHFRSSSRGTNGKIISRDELKTERQVAFSSPVLSVLMLSIHSIY